MSAVLIIGASSAIARSLAQYYLEHERVVLWLSRSAPDFQHGRLLVIPAPDLTDCDDWALHNVFFADVIDRLKQQQVTTIFNCIGWLHEEHLKPEKSLAQSSVALLRQTLLVNLEIPIFYLRGLWPYITRTANLKYLQLSAKVGSINDNHLGGWYSYRSSKAALNQWIRTASIELQRSNKSAAIITLHPGTTDSPLSKPFQRNLPLGQLQDAHQTAVRLAAVAQSITADHSGMLLNWDGAVLPF
jgi:NAD(P)-dependent dehydrogenase (short-subunit alcohol dehydrogenase family)